MPGSEVSDELLSSGKALPEVSIPSSELSPLVLTETSIDESSEFSWAVEAPRPVSVVSAVVEDGLIASVPCVSVSPFCISGSSGEKQPATKIASDVR